LRVAAGPFVESREDGGYRRGILADGCVYVCWDDLFECEISADGRRIDAAPLTDVPEEIFDAFLIGPLLSYSLARQGVETLHMSSVEFGGIAVGLLGASGAGKSTLAAAFVNRGARLLTDDVLALGLSGDRVMGEPGLARLKLWPSSVPLLNSHHGSIAFQRSEKRAYVLPPSSVVRERQPLTSIFELRRSDAVRGVSIERLGRREAFMTLTANAYNTTLSDRDRLERYFSAMQRVTQAVPAFRVVAPHDLAAVPATAALIRESASAVV
jgi:hypothetical protein